MARGKLILIIGPTGSGKSVLIEHIRATFPSLVFLRTYTTRAPRTALENSAYVFVSQEEFDGMVEKGEFIEWAKFSNASYGTKKSELEEGIADGKVLLKEMEVQGLRQILTQLPREDIKLLYIHAGEWTELERRVRARAAITEEDIAKRKQRYEDESPFKDLADVVIENYPGEIEEAKSSITDAIQAVIDSVR